MIELYTWKTPNGYKPIIMLEELGIDYELKPVPLDGTQKKDWFLKINPNGRIPALVDKETGITSFESGAMLIYLAEKYSKFLPKEGQARASVMAWLMFQMGGIGPMFGQYNHFAVFAKEKIEYGVNRYWDESLRLTSVMDTQLAKTKFLSGDEYSIADIATYPWVMGMYTRKPEILTGHENVKRWLEEISSREAVKKAYDVNFD